MIDIPYDIWLHILQFIPDDALSILISVDRVCFDKVMDNRYRDVSFESGEAYRNFVRLK